VLLHLPFCSPGCDCTHQPQAKPRWGRGVGRVQGCVTRAPCTSSRMHVPISLTHLCDLPASLPCAQLSGQKWTWQGLNTLCWAIGSISGSMADEQENRFLVTVIR
jgi:hypothetical protein